MKLLEINGKKFRNVLEIIFKASVGTLSEGVVVIVRK